MQFKRSRSTTPSAISTRRVSGSFTPVTFSSMCLLTMFFDTSFVASTEFVPYWTFTIKLCESHLNMISFPFSCLRTSSAQKRCFSRSERKRESYSYNVASERFRSTELVRFPITVLSDEIGTSPDSLRIALREISQSKPQQSFTIPEFKLTSGRARNVCHREISGKFATKIELVSFAGTRTARY